MSETTGLPEGARPRGSQGGEGMTTTLPEPQTLTDEDHGTRGRIGPFDWDLWEDGGKRAKFAVHHTASSSLLAFFRKPGECREYITSGQAQADYAGKRTERGM